MLTGRSAGLGWTVETNGSTTNVSLTGEFDLVAVAGVDENLVPVISSADERVAIDLGGLDFMDSTGLAFLLRAKRDLDARGVALVIENVSDAARRVLDVSGASSWLSPAEPVASVTDLFTRKSTG